MLLLGISHEKHESIEWIWSVADLGGSALDACDDRSTNLCRIRAMLGPGHLWACILRTVSSICFNYGFEPLACMYGSGFKTPKAQTYLRDGKNLRKTRDFFKFIRIAAMNAFVREYKQHALSEGQTPSIEGFEQHTIFNTETKDVVFKSLVATIFIVLPALELIEKGLRNNDMLSFWGAVLTLLPLLLLRNNYKYVPAILRERAIYQYLCPDAVKEEYTLIWSYFGQGLDFVLEEVNRRLKRCVTRGSFQEYYLASVLHDQQIGYRDTLFKELHMTDPFVLGEYVEKTELQFQTIEAFENWFIQKGICKLDEARVSMKTLNGSCELNPDANMVHILARGKQETETYAAAFKAHRVNPSNPVAKIPSPIRMNSKEGSTDILPYEGNFADGEDDDDDDVGNAE